MKKITNKISESTKTERLLAYKLSNIIPMEELEQVSGGFTLQGSTTQEFKVEKTQKPSGGEDEQRTHIWDEPKK